MKTRRIQAVTAAFMLLTLTLLFSAETISARVRNARPTYAKLYLDEGLLRIVNVYAALTGVRTFITSLDGDLTISSGDAGAPGFSLGRVAADANPMHDDAYVGVVSPVGSVVMDSAYGGDPALMLFGPGGPSDNLTRIWSSNGGGGIATSAGIFGASQIFTGASAGFGDTWQTKDVTLSGGEVTSAFDAGTTINSCAGASYTDGAARTFTPSLGYNTGERTFKVKLSGGGSEPVRVTCNVRKSYGN